MFVSGGIFSEAFIYTQVYKYIVGLIKHVFCIKTDNTNNGVRKSPNIGQSDNSMMFLT